MMARSGKNMKKWGWKHFFFLVLFSLHTKYYYFLIMDCGMAELSWGKNSRELKKVSFCLTRFEFFFPFSMFYDDVLKILSSFFRLLKSTTAVTTQFPSIHPPLSERDLFELSHNKRISWKSNRNRTTPIKLTKKLIPFSVCYMEKVSSLGLDSFTCWKLNIQLDEKALDTSMSFICLIILLQAKTFFVFGKNLIFPSSSSS